LKRFRSAKHPHRPKARKDSLLKGILLLVLLALLAAAVVVKKLRLWR
jgi:hypothetical protein